MQFFNEYGKKSKTTQPRAEALKLFNYYRKNPEFSTMVALTDNQDENLIFYNSDTGVFYTNKLKY